MIVLIIRRIFVCLLMQFLHELELRLNEELLHCTKKKKNILKLI